MSNATQTSPRKPVIGIVGGIGSGKSQAAAELGRLGCLVIDSDRLNHEVLQRPAVVQEVASWWGPQVLEPCQTRLDRRSLGRRVFADASARRRLEALVHPLIAQERARILNVGVKNPAVCAIILDSPLLFESHLDRECDFIVFVESDTQTRLERVRQARGWDETELAKRSRWQMPLPEKKARSHFVIGNNGTLEQLRTAAGGVLHEIMSAWSSRRKADDQ